MKQDAWNPDQYEKFKAERSRPFYDLLALVEPAGLHEVVDLGCGTGELTAELHHRLPGARTLALDNSEAMLAKTTPFEMEGLCFAKADIGHYRPQGHFDLVFSNAALQWLPDHESLFPRILDWVAPGGQVAIQMPYNFDHPSHRIAHEVARDFPALKDQPKVHGVLTPNRYAEILDRAGFHQQRCFVQVYPHRMASGADVVEWTKGTLLTAFQSRLSAAEFATFVAEYKRRLLAEIGEGPYLYAFNRMLIWGRRD